MHHKAESLSVYTMIEPVRLEYNHLLRSQLWGTLHNLWQSTLYLVCQNGVTLCEEVATSLKT